MNEDAKKVIKNEIDIDQEKIVITIKSTKFKEWRSNAILEIKNQINNMYKQWKIFHDCNNYQEAVKLQQQIAEECQNKKENLILYKKQPINISEMEPIPQIIKEIQEILDKLKTSNNQTGDKLNTEVQENIPDQNIFENIVKNININDLMDWHRDEIQSVLEKMKKLRARAQIFEICSSSDLENDKSCIQTSKDEIIDVGNKLLEKARLHKQYEIDNQETKDIDEMIEVINKIMKESQPKTSDKQTGGNFNFYDVFR